MACNYLSMPEIPASGTKVLISIHVYNESYYDNDNTIASFDQSMECENGVIMGS